MTRLWALPSYSTYNLSRWIGLDWEFPRPFDNCESTKTVISNLRNGVAMHNSEEVTMKILDLLVKQS